ncbi:hypothetical protein CEY16_05595 [Halalkalibacillus sediminis]|uniref:Uncharacterized protein n=1 Tax=Halalkalibacillus sediminis TaxID=2018042 RepID=A0A2I0QY00_9BACI|nr:hypothetical protein [Halalkalibacillus sediminis]PKR79214.1 hypothetical protein CEY16_05595 [Halalkalibacillus sediminis]
MTTTLNFYNYYFTYNGELTNYKISDFFKSFMRIDETKRLRNLPKYGEFTLFGDYIPTKRADLKADGFAHKFSNFDRLVYLGQYRDDKPYTGTKGKDIANEIKQDVLEITHCAFFPNSQLLVLPYKHFGAKAVHLERYINRFLPYNEENGGWQFFLYQIEDGKGLSTILRSNEIRSIDLKIDVTGDSKIEDYLPKDKLFKEFFTNFFNTQKKVGSNVGSVNFSTGRKTSQPMDTKKIIYFLSESKLSGTMFESAKVRYVDPDTKELVTTDLKHEGQLRTELELKDGENGKEFIAKKILEKYIESDKMGSNKYKEHKDIKRDYNKDEITTHITKNFLDKKKG